jgi:class 3 adenylate cyclase/tetratricopeptide (TPR) repeat protein
MDDLSVYLPQDRRLALARGETLPEHTNGAALFADVSGFTPLTEELTQSLGARRGIEELSVRINSVYDALIGEVDRFGGSVISFAGDAITCWFDAGAGGPSARAVMCAQGMQATMPRFPDLSVKVSVSSGPVHRFATGDPEIRLIDALAGAPVARLGMAEHLAKAGEIILDEATATLLQFSARESRTAETGERFFVLDPSFVGIEPHPIQNDPAANTQLTQVDPNLLKPWILPIVYNIESRGHGLLLTELRPTIALFVRFMGIEYENDEQAREKLDAVISQVQRIVGRYEGVVLEVTIGDKGSYLFASFGAAHVHEDDARRAVRAALEIKQSLEGFVFLNSIQFGVSSGTMRVGAYGSMTRRSFGAMGDDVNLAARLMMTAAPGEILVSQRVRKAVAEEFMVEARLPMAMKGKAEPVAVFAVLGLQRHRAIRLQEPAYVLPMIGRRREMQVLEEKLALALERQGQIIGITAEAGMGKSRLVAEGIRLAWRRSLTAFGGTCRSEGLNTPYLVWQDIWSAFFDLDSTMPLRKQIRALERELQDRAPEHVDALPLFGAVLGLSVPDNDFTAALQPKDRKAQLETVLIECLQSAAREAAAEGGGLLLVLEDLHWIDPVSFDLLELAARAIAKLPVLILVTYRPPDADPTRHTLTRLEALDHFTQLRLTELDTAETEQAIRAKLAQLFPERGGVVPPLLITRITSRAQGNPFYVEELLNYLHDRGIDPRDATALDALDLPTSLYSLILSRIDQLADSQQLSLKVASIIGRSFRFADLHNYYPSLGTAEQLRTDLQELARLDLTPLEIPEPDLTYLFKHLVTHEVAYESLAYATRAHLHGEYARYLENTYPERIDQLAPQLAHHFERAKNQDKARVYSLRAGDQAAESYANDEALAYFNRALGLTSESETRARLETLLKRERVFDLLGKRSEQRRDLTELARLAGQFDEASLLRAQIAIRQAQLEIDVGDYAAARASAQASIGEMEVDMPTLAPAPELLVDAHLLETRAMFLSGDTAAAREQLETTLSLAREVPYARGEYNALAQLGTWNWSAGNYAAATDLLEQALHLVQQAGDVRRELEILNNLGIVCKARARFSEAISYYEGAQKIARKIGDRSGEATLLNNMGSASLASGDFVRAGLYSEQAATMAAEVDEPTLQGMALSNRGEAYRELGQYVLANLTAAQALALFRSSGYRRGEAIGLDNIGLIEFSLGNHAKALEATEAALVIAREIGSRPTEASALIHRGLIYTEAGQFEEAEHSLTAAKRIVDDLGDSMQLLEVQAALARAALARGRPENLERAQSQIEELANEILKEPPTEKSHILPLWMYLTCIRVVHARSDPHAAQLIARAGAELRARSEKIADAALRIGYLNVPEHRAIVAFVSLQ